MQYRYEIKPQDYSDVASGRVFYSVPGHPAFPVRLASEIFQRCMAHRETIYQTLTPCTLYDPCCGAAYHLSVLGFLHGRRIREIIASDIDPKAVDLAKRNLGLLGVPGLDKRIHEITTMAEQYGKDSHKDALRSARLLKDKLAALDQQNPITTKVFQANATDKKTILENIAPGSVDVVFTDIPYGQRSLWQDADTLSNPRWFMLDALIDVLSSSSIVAIASDKSQKVSHEKYQRVEQFQVGKRRVVILKPFG
jgi:tRNA G10  N-methylase Trm11